MEDYTTQEFLCIDPREINPIQGCQNNSLDYQVNVSVYPKSPDISECGTLRVYGSSAKLEMEEFKDLSSLIPKESDHSMAGSIYELNTPIVDKTAFEFNTEKIRKKSTNAQEYDMLFKMESEKYDLFSESYLDQDHIPLFSYTLDNINVIETSEDHNLCSLNQDYLKQNQVIYDPSLATNFDEDIAIINPLRFENLSPDASNSSSAASGFDGGEKMLTLSLNIKTDISSPIDLNTPDVLDSFLDVTESFNMVELIDSSDATTINTEELLSLIPPIVKSEYSEESNTSEIKPKRKRKRDSSDEEYIPPAKLLEKEIDSDFSEEESETKPVKKRGRPRRAPSVASSTCSRDGEYKYRDLRDKNNEASRKSRLKRKTKEKVLEKECEELLESNIKLKAQVEELEKTVTHYRDNLFKILLKK